MAKAKSVDDYIAGLDGWQSEVVTLVRGIVEGSAPDAAASIKWSQPVFEQNGPFCYVRAFKDHVNFGFWRGAELPDPEGLLQGDGDKMRHIRLSSPDEVESDAFAALVRSAVELNEKKGDPTKG
ncbi:MAG: DUF1801 domain-containing protein [Bacteroidetes bacterium]|nr:DUF1801 domain-containing protein [Bacteroidota bacterium]